MRRTILNVAAAVGVLAFAPGAPALAEVVQMAEIEGWNVSAVNDDGRRVRCIAVKTVSERHFKLVSDGEEFFAGINRSWATEGAGSFQVDGAETPVTFRYDGEYTYFRLNDNWQDRLAAGDMATFLLGKTDIRFSLAGSAAAMERVKLCASKIPAERRGSGFSGRAAAEAATE